ncbi:MAG: dipeptide ABC transporter ATP-binding protein [Solirubrobacteraceae bacterium]
MAEPILQVADLSVTFRTGGGDVHAVRGIDFELAPGEVLGIVGESGSGKSATSLAVMGLLPPTATVGGSVLLGGQELTGLGDRELSRLRGKRISMVFQDPLSALTPVYSIGDQVAETIRVHNDVTKQAALDRAVELLDIVGIPEARRRASAYPHEFSGGMRQRVMIAMAIANDPDVIIADEPTTALDVTIQAQVLEALRTAREATGAAMVLITHDLSVVAGFADRVAVMYAGRLVETGTVEEVYYQPRMPYTMGLLGAIPRIDESGDRPLVPIEGSPPSLIGLPDVCPFSPRCPLAVDVCRETEPALRAVPTPHQPGHRGACHRMEHIEDNALTPLDVYPLPDIAEAAATRIPREERPAVLEIENVKRHFPLLKGAIFKRQVGTVKAVDGISFDIREGEVLGLVGESGCGKTTTLLEVLELTAPDDGRVVVLGHDTGELDKAKRRELRRDLSVVFQDPLASLDPRLPVSDLIAEPMVTHGYAKAKIAERTRELLRLVGLNPEHSSRYPQQFSGGQRQRVAIARALALEPRLLVLDEPVSALDVSIQAGVVNLLEDLRARLGLSYLFVAHDLSVVRHIADRVAVMYLGRIAEIGEVDGVYSAPGHPYTQALLSAIPLPDPRKERSRKRIVLEGDLPSPADPPAGCLFRTRCQKFANELSDEQRELCIAQHPPLNGVGDDHRAACHYAERVDVIQQ